MSMKVNPPPRSRPTTALSWTALPSAADRSIHGLIGLRRRHPPSCRRLCEGPDPNEVVDRRGEDEGPPRLGCPAMAELPQRAHRLEPAEDLLDSLADPLTHLVSRMTGRAPIDGARSATRVLGHVGRDPEATDPRHEISTVIGLVLPQRPPPPPLGHPARQGQPDVALRRAGRLAHLDGHGQAMAVLHQDVSLVGELGLPSLA